MPKSSLVASSLSPHYALTGQRTTHASGSLIEAPKISFYKLYGHCGNEELKRGRGLLKKAVHDQYALC
jgi:hypothetical protein